ncbi:NAD(P)-binding domain-containing protein [Marinobacterium mangrovicola]|uniref:Pyrroline-5-carboxylate reductase n=1 Tax=Marinobacterium mangrovicola TaxID=1476959 RepID=A0A4R1GCC5_9GAMM|nr:NAD(P)-binding domain-containing protein [Marinobacterium mangrovicola]TCK04215.1 pyrroline-5-carboxylate reductase [Marinobacterium mangrovicola]
MSDTLGILGVGHLASYVVAGLRNAGDKRHILLSPRGKETAERLRLEHDCEIVTDNQTLVDRCDTLLIAVRPAQLESLLKPLSFKPNQLLISCAAGVSLAQLKPLTAPALVVRTLPLACAEFGAGAVPLFPDNETAGKLLSQLGELIVFENEEKFELASTAACMNGWIYDFLDQLSGWFADQGLSPEQARALVTQQISGATALASARPDLPLSEISASIATEGTFTKTGLDLLADRHAIAPWKEACEAIQKALSAGSE